VQDKPTTSLSVAIVCYHTPIHQLQALLNSLLVAVQKLHESAELQGVLVYLIDNSAYPELRLEQFSDLLPACRASRVELRLLTGQGNVGYGSAHNLVLPDLLSEFHLMLNPDVVLAPDSLRHGIHYLLENMQVVLASPRATDSQGNKQYLCKTYPALLTFLVRGFLPRWLRPLFADRLARFEMHALPESQPSTNIPIVSGCCMLCRTKSLREVHGFDEDYFLYFEDFDLSLRMHAEGQIAYLPDMAISHGGGNAARKGFWHLQMFAASARLFYQKNGWRWLRQE